MKYIINTSNDPAYNIALEEYCFKNLTQFNEIFILWINSPCIVVGKLQNIAEEINSQYVNNNNIKVVRRISGGGAVYHDLNNLNYTIISTKNKDSFFDFKSFSFPVIEVLKDLGITATCSGRNDIEIDSLKICGNAQAYYRDRILHHGCLLFDVDMSNLSKSLKVSKDKIQSKGAKSVRARVSNIINHLDDKSIDVNKFKNLIHEKMRKTYSEYEEYVLNDNDLENIKKLYDTKHNTWDWIYGTSPDYNIRKDNKYPTGKITVFLDINNSIINNIKIYGDFFGIKDMSDIENMLINTKYTYNSIYEILKDINISDYFYGIELKDFILSICEL